MNSIKSKSILIIFLIVIVFLILILILILIFILSLISIVSITISITITISSFICYSIFLIIFDTFCNTLTLWTVSSTESSQFLRAPHRKKENDYHTENEVDKSCFKILIISLFLFPEFLSLLFF